MKILITISHQGEGPKILCRVIERNAMPESYDILKLEVGDIEREFEHDFMNVVVLNCQPLPEAQKFASGTTGYAYAMSYAFIDWDDRLAYAMREILRPAPLNTNEAIQQEVQDACLGFGMYSGAILSCHPVEFLSLSLTDKINATTDQE